MPILARNAATALAISLLPVAAMAQPITGADWQLLAMDGVIFEAEATLRLEVDGAVSGRAPCNQWSAMNGAALPDLSLAAIRATRMACDKLAEEQAFFDALSAMTLATHDEGGPLILTNAKGQSMEFVQNRGAEGTICTTCPPAE